MKKIFSILMVISLSIFAYEYKIAEFVDGSGIEFESFYYDNTQGVVRQKNVRVENGSITLNTTSLYNSLYQIKRNGNNYISSNEFENILRNDFQFLNDLYVNSTNMILNYFYNDHQFGSSDYILYDNYTILYNEDGLAVESIVDDVWAGLYDDSQKDVSGYLYSSSGALIYYNGEKLSYLESIALKLIDNVKDCLSSSVYIIAVPLGVILSVVFVLAILYYVVVISRNSLSKEPTKWTSNRRRKLFGNHDDLHGF